jgi:hypothetical protein
MVAVLRRPSLDCHLGSVCCLFSCVLVVFSFLSLLWGPQIQALGISCMCIVCVCVCVCVCVFVEMQVDDRERIVIKRTHVQHKHACMYSNKKYTNIHTFIHTHKLTLTTKQTITTKKTACTMREKKICKHACITNAETAPRRSTLNMETGPTSHTREGFRL